MANFHPKRAIPAKRISSGNAQSNGPLAPRQAKTPTLATTAGGELLLSLPYSLKDAFRAFFKTAEWRRELQGFVAADTQANRNKWARFVEETKPAVEQLAAADKEEASMQEIEALKAEADRIFRHAKMRIETAVLQAEQYVEETARLRGQASALEAKRADAERKCADAQTEWEQARIERERQLEIVRLATEADAMPQLLVELAEASRRRGSSRAQTELLLNKLGMAYEKLKSLGYESPLLSELVANASTMKMQEIADAASFAARRLYDDIR